MEETKKTHKETLSKGIRIMLICLFLMFIGPTLLHIAFSNKEKPLYIPLLILGVIFSIGAILALLKGINTITDSLFGKKKK
ncbi:DUF6095 family protein [Winogradskyella sp.]|jgi:TRAP-type C4-dicarboxylate transport system permease small subunit|nr:DUF6095 family protein [Winogradskyella sp.]MDA8768925.1 DUF6095 family protein [Winogradskyella sp.]MDA8874850.1 DUF6095 family protein [Winogradskyella sp.]MDG1661517.1 DUF6095 family protein [Winogradskyella sp.]